MAIDTNSGGEELRSQRRAAQVEQPGREQTGQTEQSEEADSASNSDFGGSGYSSAMLAAPGISGRGNAPVRASVMRSMQSTHGNRAVQRVVQRYAEPAPWQGQGQRHSDWNGMPSYPNIGVEPSNPGSAWSGGGGGTGGGAWSGGGSGGGFGPGFPGGGPFYNPTPDVPLPFHPMPGGGSGMGWDMPGKGQEPGPYAYYKGNGKTGTDFGIEAGVGAFHGEGNVWGMPVTDDLLYAKGQLGSWDDGQGGSRTGFNASTGVANWSVNQGGFVSGQAEALTANAEASVGDSGATLGAQATVVGGSMTFGGDPTGKSDHDESIRLGLSEGVGMAGRLHWGDKDHDGHREYGFGFDVGPFSADWKSEDPIRSLARTAGGPLAEYALGPGNATVPVENAVRDGWDTAKKYSNEIGDAAVNAYDTVSNGASGAYDTLSNAAGGAYDTVASGLGGAADSASNAASSAWDWLNN